MIGHAAVGPSTALSVVALVVAAVLLVATSVLRELRVPRGGTSAPPGRLGLGLALALGTAAAVAVAATLVRLLSAVS